MKNLKITTQSVLPLFCLVFILALKEKKSVNLLHKILLYSLSSELFNFMASIYSKSYYKVVTGIGITVSVIQLPSNLFPSCRDSPNR